MDVKNVFLHRDLNKELNMEGPPKLRIMTSILLAYRLKKYLYDQVGTYSMVCKTQFKIPIAWYAKLNSKLIEDGYKICNVDHSLFTTTTKCRVCIPND